MNKLNHIAFIMDGNGRWGKRRNKGRNYGHYAGAGKSLRDLEFINKELFRHFI